MHRALTVIALIACGSQEPAAPAASKHGSSASPPTMRGGSGTTAPTSGDPPAAAEETDGSGARDDASEIAKLVVRDVASNALGGQTIDPACVTVNVLTAGDWTIASAWLKNCGDKTARSILWLYKRQSGPWNEDYVGQPPKCWKGVPPDIAPAVATVTKIPTC